MKLAKFLVSTGPVRTGPGRYEVWQTLWRAFAAKAAVETAARAMVNAGADSRWILRGPFARQFSHQSALNDSPTNHHRIHLEIHCDLCLRFQPQSATHPHKHHSAQRSKKARTEINNRRGKEIKEGNKRTKSYSTD